MGHRDETRDTERNWQMPEETRIQWILDLKQRANKDRYAQEPGDAANRRCKPRQVNQTPARLRQFLKRDYLAANIGLKAIK